MRLRGDAILSGSLGARRDEDDMELRSKFVSLPRWVKHSMLIGHDFIVLFAAVWLAYCMRLGTFYVPDRELLLLWLAAPVIGSGVSRVRRVPCFNSDWPVKRPNRMSLPVLMNRLHSLG